MSAAGLREESSVRSEEDLLKVLRDFKDSNHCFDYVKEHYEEIKTVDALCLILEELYSKDRYWLAVKCVPLIKKSTDLDSLQKVMPRLPEKEARELRNTFFPGRTVEIRPGDHKRYERLAAGDDVHASMIAFHTFDVAGVRVVAAQKTLREVFKENLIRKLQDYIARIERHKKSESQEIDFGYGFFFAPISRAAGRQANYELAKFLCQQLLQSVLTTEVAKQLFSANFIAGNRKEIIRERGLDQHSGWWTTRSVCSQKLRAIICEGATVASIGRI